MRRGLSGALVAALALVAVGAVPSSIAPAAAAEEVYTPPASGSWQVEGRGWGHGIGMSQWGAQAQALQGRTADQILDFYYPGTVRYDIGQDYPLRVRLLSLAGATMTAGPVPGGSLVVMDVASGASATAPAGARVSVTRSGGSFSVAVGGAPFVVGSSAVVAGPVQVTGAGGAQVWAYRADGSGTRYPGALRANATGTGTLEVVNHVPMEQYLRGVVPRESPASFGSAALQAQAVAARTYALAVRTAGTADLCDTTQCQVYGGAAVVSASGAVTERYDARTDAAVAATARIARYYGGGPAFTQFSSSNGGYSKGGGQPYLVAQADPYTGAAPGDTVSRWTGSLAVSRVQQSCPSGGTLQRMVLTRDGRGDLGGRITSARLECSTGTATVNTPAFGLLSSWWRPTSVGQPFGNAEVVEGTSGGVTVRGWAIDPDTVAPIAVRVLVDGAAAGVVTANGVRPDVGATFPAFGSAHGFDMTIPSAPRTAEVCVVAVNTGPGADVVLRCRTVTVLPGAPYGSVDAATGVPAQGGAPQGIAVRGWAVDPDAGTASIDVEIRVDGTAVARRTADASRPDVGTALPGLGDRHGYSATVPASPGAREVCILAVNTPAGPNPTLGCRSVTVPGGPPVGNFESLEVTPGGVRVRGWALDPETTAPINVWFASGSTGKPILANVSRPDIAAAYPALGALHGFDATVPLPAGSHSVCVTAINAGSSGHDVQLGCRPVTVPDASPVGNFDSVEAVPGGVRARGWALDPETTGPIFVWVSVSGGGGPAVANRSRPDLMAVYPAHGANHGFELTVPVPAGRHSVCVTAINAGSSGRDLQLGCRPVTVPDASPVGSFDSVEAVPGGVRARGWALDPETTGPIFVWVSVSGGGGPAVANRSRPDLMAVYPAHGANHGFELTVPVPAGRHSVCVTAINAGSSGHDVQLGCRPVTVR